MPKILVDNRVMIDTEELSWISVSGKQIFFCMKNTTERTSIWLDSEKEARYVFGRILNIMEVPEEHKIEVFA